MLRQIKLRNFLNQTMLHYVIHPTLSCDLNPPPPSPYYDICMSLSDYTTTSMKPSIIFYAFSILIVYASFDLLLEK